jgi:hypothetical protein
MGMILILIAGYCFGGLTGLGWACIGIVALHVFVK